MAIPSSDLLTELKANSLDDIPSDVLSSVLTYHVVAGMNVRSTDLSDGMELKPFRDKISL